MDEYKIVLLLLVVSWWCAATECNIVVSKGPFRSHVTGGYKSIETRSSKSVLDCKQYANDYEVLYHFPFRIMINPMIHYWHNSIASMDNMNTFVHSLDLTDTGSTVPESIFCLKRLEHLTINNMVFSNGVVPDTLSNLQRLRALSIFNTFITNMTNQLASLTRLYSISLNNCSLSQTPNLSNMPDLRHVYLENNRLSEINGLRSDVDCLHLSGNLFTEIPTMKTPTSLAILRMNNNPLKDMMTLGSFTNLAYVELSNTTLSFIPPTIGKLHRLAYIDLSHNKLFYLPRNILYLNHLTDLYINNNMFSANDIQTIKMEFNKSHPNTTLRI